MNRAEKRKRMFEVLEAANKLLCMGAIRIEELSEYVRHQTVILPYMKIKYFYYYEKEHRTNYINTLPINDLYFYYFKYIDGNKEKESLFIDFNSLKALVDSKLNSILLGEIDAR